MAPWHGIAAGSIPMAARGTVPTRTRKKSSGPMRRLLQTIRSLGAEFGMGSGLQILGSYFMDKDSTHQSRVQHAARTPAMQNPGRMLVHGMPQWFHGDVIPHETSARLRWSPTAQKPTPNFSNRCWHSYCGTEPQVMYNTCAMC